MKPNLLISACLIGVPCRYDGKSVPRVDILKLEERYNVIPVCPEIFGGLPTPRTPSERVGDRVVMRDGTDVTENFMRGAECTLNIAKSCGAGAALLKSRSPSCGKGMIYDGSFTGTLKEGEGLTAQLLMKDNIKVYSEDELPELL